ncbi:MAG: hypothetical protein M0Q13_05950 [Methanothrix sp.]|nr:hypothetical protein [Methanothrix sp.]
MSFKLPHASKCARVDGQDRARETISKRTQEAAARGHERRAGGGGEANR